MAPRTGTHARVKERINTREMGCCLSGNISLRGGFAPSMLSSLRCSERNPRVKGVVVQIGDVPAQCI